MVSSLRLGVGFLCLLVTICCVYAEQGDYEKLVRALANKSSDRQFISTIKKWFRRSSQMDKVETTTPEAKIKYLPVYVPYPVQTPINTPPLQSEYYGAYQDPQKKETVENMYQGVHVMPNAHVEDYYLPFSGQLPVVVKRRQPTYYSPPVTYQEVQVPATYGYGNTYNTQAFETEVLYDDDGSDTEVVENAALLRVINKGKPRDTRVRKVRRKEDHVPRSSAF